MSEQIEEPDNIQPFAESPITADESEIDVRIREAAEAAQLLRKTIPQTVIADGPTKIEKHEEKALTKPQIVALIMKSQEALKLPRPQPESYFQRKNKPELQEILDELKNQIANKLNGTVHELREETEAIKEARREWDIKQEKPSLSLDPKQAAKFLFNMNYTACSILEVINKKSGIEAAIDIDITGLATETVENKEVLLDILEQIYVDHAQTISPYISPINQYFMVMATCMGSRAMKNEAAKQKKSPVVEELPDTFRT